MRRSMAHGLLVVVIVLLLGVLSVSPAAPSTALAATTRIVCVDAGHGGSDPGAVYYGLEEEDLNLDIAFRLQALLEGAGYGVIMTRTGDQGLGNTERANICNAGNADSVISIHLNASTNRNVNYFKAFYGKQIKDRAFTQLIWDNYNLSKPGSSEPLDKSPIGQFASGLLLKSNAPATLAETVFLSYEPEARLLGDGTGQRQQEIAQQLFNGLNAWYNTN